MQQGSDDKAASRLSRRWAAQCFRLSVTSTACQGGPQLPLDLPIRYPRDG